MEQEIWKVYKTTCNGKRVYEVSDLGNVKINGKLVDFSNQESYYRIGCFHVHRAVAELFIPNPENKPCVDHINTNKHDNRAVNLRWCTYNENNNNPLTRKYKSEVQNRPEVRAKQRAIQKEVHNRPEVRAKHRAVAKDRCHMSNGIDHVFVKQEMVDYYLEREYHFGIK